MGKYTFKDLKERNAFIEEIYKKGVRYNYTDTNNEGISTVTILDEENEKA